MLNILVLFFVFYKREKSDLVILAQMLEKVEGADLSPG